jgi:hypothetical protein
MSNPCSELAWLSDSHPVFGSWTPTRRKTYLRKGTASQMDTQVAVYSTCLLKHLQLGREVDGMNHRDSGAVCPKDILSL